MGEAVWLLFLCVVALGECTFSVSRQYHRRHADRGPMVIALDDSEGALVEEPTEIFEEAKNRQALQTDDRIPPQPSTTEAQLNTPGEQYAVHWDGLPQTVRDSKVKAVNFELPDRGLSTL